MPNHRAMTIPCIAMIIAACAWMLPACATDKIHTTPPASEMTQAQWTQLQLEAAEKSDEIMSNAQKLPGLLAQYEYMQSKYDAGKERAFQVIFGQYLSWYQTFIGDYAGARASFSIAQPQQADDARSPLNANYRSRPAAEVIAELAKFRKAVFFNEAHSAPITRTLTIEMLATLRKQGYNYFAAETLYDSDKDLQKRGYPTPKSGFYINEPLYGEMVRSALKLGYKVVAYDVENAGVGDPRERAGAKRLARLFERDPKARLVVDAGFAHVQKSGVYLRGHSMGEFFHKISGIDPLTIEQTMMIQHARKDQDHPYYLAVMAALDPAQPIVFVGDKNKPWTLKPGKYDVSVFFPQDKTVKGRPDWLTLNGLRQAYAINGDQCRNKFPCLIEARYADEGDDAVPADRAVLDIVEHNVAGADRVVTGPGTVQSRLFLRPGKYRLSATDTRNHQLSSSEITVGKSEGSNK